MPRAALLWIAVAATMAGCSGKKRQRRTSDAAPVELIVAPQLDAGKPGETDEHEPNETPDVASPLAIGGSARGKIEPDADVDTYRVEVPEAGALTVLVTAVDGVDLALEIEDAAGAVVARSDRGTAKVVEGVPNLAVSPGRYTVAVRKIPPKAKKPPRGRRAAPPPEPPPPGSAPAYHLTAQLAPFAANAEREPDDDRGTANDLIVNTPVTGYIGWSNDLDLWKLSLEVLSARNVIDIEIGPVEGVAFTLEVADGVGNALLVRKGQKNAPLVVRSLAPAAEQGAPPFHYLTIRGDRSNPETAYQLTVSGHDLETDGETEPNDTLERAMPIGDQRTAVRGAWSPGDVDYIAIPPEPEPRTLDITLAPEETADLTLELLVDGKQVAESKKPGKGVDDKLSAPVPPDARAVVRVRGSDASAEARYTLTVREGAQAPP